MRRWIALGAVFVFSLLLFLIVYMPAAMVVNQLPSLRPGGAPLTFAEVRGPWWEGTANSRWKDQRGRLRWTLDWQGLTPGVQVSMVSGDLHADGWLGAAWGDWRLRDWRATVPVAPFSDQVPQGDADGRVDVSLLTLELDDGKVVDAKGTLTYSGGTVSWGRGDSARVPPLDGRLEMVESGPRLSVTDPDGQRLVLATVEQQRLHVRVLRAWPQLLGVSQGGDPDDVVFRMNRPLAPGTGG